MDSYSIGIGAQTPQVDISGYLKDLKPVEKRATPGERIMRSFFPSAGTGWPGGWSQDRLEYVHHMTQWVYNCVDAISHMASANPPVSAYIRHKKDKPKTHVTKNFKRFVRKNRDNYSPPEEIDYIGPGNLLYEIIQTPNKMDDICDILYESQMFLELCGVSYIWLVPNRNGIPIEMWVIPSHWVFPRIGGGKYGFGPWSDHLVESYEIRPWGGVRSSGTFHISPRDMMVEHYKSPVNKIDGYSALYAIAKWVDLDESVTNAHWAQMINRARPDVAIELGEGYSDPSPAEIERIQARFDTKYSGEINTGRTVVTPPDSTVKPLSFSPQHMEYIQSGDATRDKVCSTFRVPKTILGISDEMTFGGIASSKKAFWEFCMKPKMAMRGRRWTKFLGSRFRPSKKVIVRMWFPDDSPEDPQQINADIQTDLQANAITPNEVREIREREPYAHGGNDPMIQGPGGPVPLPMKTGEDDYQQLYDLVPTIDDGQEDMFGMGGGFGDEMTDFGASPGTGQGNFGQNGPTPSKPQAPKQPGAPKTEADRSTVRNPNGPQKPAKSKYSKAFYKAVKIIKSGKVGEKQILEIADLTDQMHSQEVRLLYKSLNTNREKMDKAEKELIGG